MNIQVILPRTNKEKQITVKENATIQSILQTLSIKPDTCLTLINNKPVPIDTTIQENQTLTLLEVTSGG